MNDRNSLQKSVILPFGAALSMTRCRRGIGIQAYVLPMVKVHFALVALCCFALFPGVSSAAGTVFRNSIGMEFVPIPDGTFMMGSETPPPGGKRDETPRHEVTISRSFHLGAREVTQAQWTAVMGHSPYDMRRTSGTRWDSLLNQPGRFISPEKPVTVSWEDAEEFIARLNSLERTNAYRLPTEAEWEYACRAGSNSRYSFGDNERELGRYAWYGGDFTTGSTHDVGTREPNAWGLYDMHGNVWEWVRDYYGGEYYSVSPKMDPQGPESGSGRVVRGGSWHSTSDAWHSAFRKEYPQDYRGISIGFRVVRETP